MNKLKKKTTIHFEKSIRPSKAYEVIALIAENYGVLPNHVLGRKRTQEVVDARFAAYWIFRNMDYWSWPQIAALFDRDHSSIIYGFEKMTQLRSEDISVKTKTNRLLIESKKILEGAVTVKEYAEQIVTAAAAAPVGELVRKIDPDDMSGLAKIILKEPIEVFTVGELVTLKKALDK